MINMINGDFVKFYRWLKINGFDVREEETPHGRMASFNAGKYAGVIEEFLGKEILHNTSGNCEELYKNFRTGFRYLLGVELTTTPKLERLILLSRGSLEPFDHYRLLYCKDGTWKVNGVCGIHGENIITGGFRLARTILGENFLNVYWDTLMEQSYESTEK